jgi:hypothetical protein
MLALSEAQVVLKDGARAELCAEHALEEFRSEGDPLAIGWALRALGNAKLSVGNPRAAREQFEEARDLFQDIGARLALALTFLSLGTVAEMRGDASSARASFQTAFGICTELELPWWTARLQHHTSH